MRIKYPKGIKVVYDAGPDLIDRYTVYYSNPKAWGIMEVGPFFYIGMSARPFHPQGFGQHGIGYLGRHNGKKISFESLPEDCKKAAQNDLKEGR